MRNTIAICAVALLSAACSESKNVADASKADPNTPAVIQAPPIILPSDTAKVDTMPAYRDRMSAALSEINPEYSLLTATAVLGDRRMLAATLAPDVTMRLADTTFTGRDAAVFGFTDFMLRNSVKDLLRQSRVLNAIGPTYTDSGQYLMVSQRGVGKPVEQRGTYVSVWTRSEKAERRWHLLRDELTPDPPAKKR